MFLELKKKKKKKKMNKIEIFERGFLEFDLHQTLTFVSGTYTVDLEIK